MAERITSSFGAKSTAREVVAGHDLSGKVAIVTGAATGIGVETARALTLAGAEVIIAARKPELGEAVNPSLDSLSVMGRRLETRSTRAIPQLYETGCASHNLQ